MNKKSEIFYNRHYSILWAMISGILPVGVVVKVYRGDWPFWGGLLFASFFGIFWILLILKVIISKPAVVFSISDFSIDNKTFQWNEIKGFDFRYTGSGSFRRVLVFFPTEACRKRIISERKGILRYILTNKIETIAFPNYLNISVSELRNLAEQYFSESTSKTGQTNA